MDELCPPPQKCFYKNIEILRFILAWAIVACHLPMIPFKQEGLLGLDAIHSSYFKLGGRGVILFFVIAFFFLILKTSPKQKMFSFVASKWLRLAPLFIVVSTIALILNRTGFITSWHVNIISEIEADLLVREFISKIPNGQFGGVSWYCAQYMLVAVFWLGLIKTIPSKYIPLIIGILSFIAWRIYQSHDDSLDQTIIGTRRGLNAFYTLGLSYLLYHAYTTYSATLKRTSTSTIIYTIIEVVLTIIILCDLFAATQILSVFLLIISFCWLIWSFINRLGYLSRLLERDWCSFLGKYAYAIYVVHPLALHIAKNMLLPRYKHFLLAHPYMFLVGLAVAIMVMAMLGHHLVEAPIIRYMKRRRTMAIKATEESSLAPQT